MITFREAVVIRRLDIRHFLERVQKLLPAGTFGAQGDIAFAAPHTDSLSHRKADDLLQRDVLARRQFLRLFEHRLRDLGFNGLHVIHSPAIWTAFAPE